MEQSKFCRICLVSDVKMYHLDMKSSDSLGFIYTQLTGIQIRNKGHHVCFECAALLKKFHLFKLKSHRTHRLLSRISRNPTAVTKEMVDIHIDRKKNELESNLVLSETICYEPTINLTNVCPIIHNGILKKVDDKLEIEIKPGVVFSNEYGKDITESEDFNEEYVKQEVPALNKVWTENDKLQKEYKLEKINVIFGNQETETHSMLHVIKTSLDDFDNDTIEYLDENILAEVEESVVNEYLEKNIPVEVEESVVNEYLEKNIPAEVEKTVVNEYLEENIPTGVEKPAATEYLEEKKIKKSVDTSNPEAVNEKPTKRRRKKNTLKKESDNKVKKRCKQSLYKINNKVDWNLEFKGYGRVVMLTPEEARNEMLKRKESKNYKRLPYKCQLCFRAFERQFTFGNHMKYHKEENGKYECDFCHVRFTKQMYLRGHKLNTHLRKFHCLLCPFTSFSTDRGRTHVFLHQGKKYPCTECDEVFSMPNSMIMHKRLKHLNKSDTEVVCGLCGNIFASDSGKKLHNIRIHKTDKNSFQGPKCEECGVHFDSEKAWSRHLVLSSRHNKTLTESSICKHCGERFSNEDLLNTHVHETHIRRQLPHHRVIRKLPSNCRLCGEKLHNQNEYTIHMSKVHARSPRTPSIYKRNVKTDKENKKVKKRRNKAGYVSQSNSLKPKPFVCEVCGRAYQWERQLKEHQLSHTGERPYGCDICDKRYRSKAVLYMHKKVHESTQHICDICGKCYTLKSKIVRHIKLHMGIRPYKCLICDKAFPHKCELKLHVKYVHEKVPWPKRIRKRNVANNRMVTNENYQLNSWC